MSKHSGKRRSHDYVNIDLDLDLDDNQNSNISVTKPAHIPCHSEKDYVEGSILSIKLSKFLTYDLVELKPGPQLNVVIGPNGTGKSALVCAICLGLAGKTSWLGRASDPRDFIRHGSDRTVIELVLKNSQEEMSNYVIKREITRTKSHWWLNGRSTTQKNVEETVASLNIQVGNLCQFLPQEKVADFARMSQQELLENTEKSVGEAGLYEKHQTLKGAREEARRLENDVHKLVEILDQERQRNTRLEQEVKSYHERKKFLQKVEVLKLKKPWLEYIQLKEQFEHAKGEKDNKSEELKKEQRQVAPLEKRNNKLKTERDSLETASRKKTQEIRSKVKDVSDHKKNMLNVSDKIEETKAEFDSRLKDEESRKKRLHDLKDQLHALEEHLAQVDCSDTKRISVALEKVSEDMQEANFKMSQVQSDGENLSREIKTIKSEIRAYEAQLKQIKDVSNRRLEVLRVLHKHTYDAVLWLRENEDRFQHKIHEPMVIGVNMLKPQDAKIIEAHISFNDLHSFVCEDPHDLDEFMMVMKNELKLKVNAVNAPSQPASSFKPKYPISRYRPFGFENYLQSLFTCPEPVMRYLCMMYKVHLIPYGSSEVTRQAATIVQKCQELNQFYSSEAQYSSKTSRYSKAVATRNTALREPRALVDSINVDREHELVEVIKDHVTSQHKKEEQYGELQKESEKLERTINQLRESKRSLMKQKDQRKTLEHQITTKRLRIQQVIDETMDVKAEEQHLSVQLKEMVTGKCKHLDYMFQATQRCLDLAKERILLSLQLERTTEVFTDLKMQLRNGRQRLETLEQEVEELKEHVRDLKQQARDKNLEAKQLAGVGPNDDLEKKLQERGMWDDFTRAPAQLDALEGEIHSVQARAEAMFEVDEVTVHEFERRAKEIDEMESTLAKQESQKQNHQENVSRLRETWLDPLQALITRINENFSFFFTSLQCCGEVSLNVPENPEDYEKYGLCIKVKFRDNENLRELNATHQSGGERSVSTVLYMMALQELSRCPFRCVDEINQGMDPRNERKIFQLVVQTVCGRNSSQYFLLTPKLLPGLDYSNQMTVLCVYNGSHMMGHKEWNLGTFIRRRAELAG